MIDPASLNALRHAVQDCIDIESDVLDSDAGGSACTQSKHTSDPPPIGLQLFHWSGQMVAIIKFALTLS